MHHPTLAFLSVPLSLLLATTAASQTFTISQPNGNDTFGARSTGQSFTPGIGVTPSPGALPVLPLTKVTLHHGNYIPNAPSTTTYLNIYDGDPNAGGGFIGSSTNAIDTTALNFRDPMVWDFTQLPLVTTTEYWAVMSSTNTAGSLDVAVSLETEPRNGPPGPNIYTGGSGLIANIVQHPSSVDAKFEVEFFFGVVGSFMTAGTGCASSVGIATFAAPAAPRIGQGFQIDFANLAPTGLPYMAFGFSDAAWNGIALPFPLSNLVPGSSPTCLVQVSVFTAVALPLSGTTATLTIPIPNTASLAGTPFFLQGVQLEATGVSVTAKGVGLIGN